MTKSVWVFSTVAFNTQSTVAAQVVLKPYDEGRDAAEQALNALNGRSAAKKILTTSVVATRDNLDKPDVKRYIYSFKCPTS